MKTSDLYAATTNDRKTRPVSLNRMDAIACGVQARFEESTGYSKQIADTTINVARALGIPDTEINSWADNHTTRKTDEADRLREIKSLLEKLYGNSLGITV